MSQKSGTPKLSAEQVVKDIRRATRSLAVSRLSRRRDASRSSSSASQSLRSIPFASSVSASSAKALAIP
ncbi:MAG: hypothetical protein FD172_3525 [Methylocystaceae bacterium]|nr:MAG: hypothetical protein FD172_3525 [Methylocystaceae bacterium]